MQLKIEVAIIPVTDVDRALAFYRDQVGFHLDVDHRPGGPVRVVQLTPPGSGCSISMGTGLGAYDDMAPGTQRGLHLVTADLDAARAELVRRGSTSARPWTSAVACASPASPTPTATPGCCRRWRGERATRSESVPGRRPDAARRRRPPHRRRLRDHPAPTPPARDQAFRLTPPP